MTDEAADLIQVRGARTHNLRGVDVDLPLGKLTVITGLSGSGKSSLAFDTLFAEGQRRYLDCVSVHTQSLLKQLPRPDVDELAGLPPTVCVDQRVGRVPARSTLAMTTEIYDYLRLLYARAGVAHCTGCGKVVASQSVEQIVEEVLRHPERTKLMVLAPMVRARTGAHDGVLEQIARAGFVRVRVDGELIDLADVPELAVQEKHTIEAVIDRIILKEGVRQRLRESIQLAVRESEGTCLICEQLDGAWRDRLFSTKFSCPDCDLRFPAPEPRSFSFTTAWGACTDCNGFGVQGVVDDSEDVAVFRQASCDTCRGSRLQPFAAHVTFLGQTIADVTALSVDAACQQVADWLQRARENPAGELSADAALVAVSTLPDILERLRCLQSVGVGYLNLDRATRTLSGGEFQRARLAACLGTGLYGACFILDEPTSGLHPRDTQRLMQTLAEIRDGGATVVVVEHDGDVMRGADYLIDLGPGAGVEGGRVLHAGLPADCESVDSPTGRYLRGEVSSGSSSRGAAVDVPGAYLGIQHARCNNLKDVSVEIPLNQLVCVTGVSGSGKSSLIMDTLLPVAQEYCRQDGNVAAALADADCAGIEGLGEIQRVVAIDTTLPGRNRRSCIATYSPLWNDVRRIFAKTREARARGFGAPRFSFNSGPGRCDACKGRGIRDVKINFLPDLTVDCPECRGARFNRATLNVRFAGRNVADILQMRVDEAADFFSEFDKLHHLLKTFQDVGLGYLTLGQPASTFSGGEAQRVKLATELAARYAEATLFILDEPTSGLHPADIVHLVSLLRGLVETGNSVVVVEHSVDVMHSSDWIIDLGPESAGHGGTVIAAGPPAAITENEASITGRFLASGKSGT